VKGSAAEITYSRHARRRARLYGISEVVVTGILSTMDLPDGKHEIVHEAPGFRYPLKIVISIEQDETRIVTVYPLKKGRRK
jgi:hypothetical protein